MEHSENEKVQVEVDSDNLPFFHAVDAVMAGKNVFLTGEAGTGKTTFLHYISGCLQKERRQFVVLAPTGVAAVNAGGQTLHSMFRLPFGPLLMTDPRFQKKSIPGVVPPENIYTTFQYWKWKLELLEALETVVIDEISMVRSDVLQAIDRLLRVFRKRESEPFGGVQMVLIGDAYQLPPILKDNEVPILQGHYRTRFFFGCEAWAEGRFEGHCLSKIYRQTDPEFVGLLNKIRTGNLTIRDFQLLSERRMVPPEEEGFVNLVTHKRKAEAINNEKLEHLDGDSHKFQASVWGKFPESSYPMDVELELKVGAQVMVTRNNWDKEVFNGMMGKVSSVEEGEITICIEENNGSHRTVKIERVTWNNIEYKLNKETGRVESEVLGSFTHFPLALAWAITIHKSQGLTFDKVIADVGASFTHGQEYVALSRCRSLEMLFLSSDIKPSRLGPHPRVERFYRRMFGAA